MSEGQPAYAINPDPEHFTRVLLSTPRTFEADGRQWTLLSWFNSPAMRPKEKARAYIIEVATHRWPTKAAALEAAGASSGMAVYTLWSEQVPGWDEVEEILWSEPITAANFLCLITMPRVAAYWRDVLEGKSSGPKAEAARFVAHISDPTLRQGPRVMPPAPGAPHQSKVSPGKLNALLSALDEEEE